MKEEEKMEKKKGTKIITILFIILILLVVLGIIGALTEKKEPPLEIKIISMEVKDSIGGFKAPYGKVFVDIFLRIEAKKKIVISPLHFHLITKYGQLYEYDAFYTLFAYEPMGTITLLEGTYTYASIVFTISDLDKNDLSKLIYNNPFENLKIEIELKKG